MQPAARSQTRRRAGLRATQRAASDAPASGGEPGLPSSLPRKISPISESGESALLAQRVYGRTTSSDNASAEGASTTTSDPYMALVDELIDKGSDFSFKGTDDELDTRSAVEASLGYEDLGAAEQDMRVRRRRLHSRRKWERVDSALTYSGEELRSHSMPADTKFPVDALTGEPEAGQNLSSIYCATESAPASPFGSTHAVPRSRVAQGIDRRMDSAQDSAHGIPRSALPVIYSAQGSEAADTPKALEQPRSDAWPEEPTRGTLGSPSFAAGISLADMPASIGSASAPARLQIPLDKVTEGFRLGGTLTPRHLGTPMFSLQDPGPSSSSAPMAGASSAFNSLLSQCSSGPAPPPRLARQRDVSGDVVLNTVCESVQSALNMPYISITALGNRRILIVALSSMPREARAFGTGPLCSWLLEPQLPGLYSIPDCQADPMCRDHSVVAGKPAVRMFAAAPLISPTGHRLGALCVGSQEASPLTPEHAKLLSNFAKAVVRRLQALKFVQLDDAEKAAMIEQCEQEQLATVLVNTATVDWHMLHANEAWRQLTGVELQRGISTGLWESFEFISAQPKGKSTRGGTAGGLDVSKCGGFIVNGDAFIARVKRRVAGDSEEQMILHFRPIECRSQESPESSTDFDAKTGPSETPASSFTPFYTATAALPSSRRGGSAAGKRSSRGCACAVM